MATPNQELEKAILAARKEDYLQALTLFLDIYGGEELPSMQNVKAAAGLSYFGLCLALVQRKFKPAIDLCKRAIEMEFYEPTHYANLTRVYTAAGNRRKALETVEAGLKLHPEHLRLLEVRDQLGIRSRPAVPFLDRSHPINVTLGQSRHARKIAADAEKKKAR